MTSKRQAAYDAAAKVMARQFFYSAVQNHQLSASFDPDDPDAYVDFAWKSFSQDAAAIVDAAMAAA